MTTQNIWRTASMMMRAAKLTPTARSGRMLVSMLLMLLTTATAWADESVPYIDENGEQQYCTDYTVIEMIDEYNYTPTSLEAGKWYVLKEYATIGYPDGNTITGNGAANIILCDGATLYYIPDNNNLKGSLNIYGQSAGTGKFECEGSGDCDAVMEGNLTLYGGQVSFLGQSFSEYYEFQYQHGIHGNVIIYGGSLTTTGGDGGNQEAGDGIWGDVTMYGGSLTTKGGDVSDLSYNPYGGAGIHGSVTMHGGTLTANGGYGESGIDGNVIFYGGSLKAQGGDNNNNVMNGINGNASLSWTNATDRFTANSIRGTVIVAQGKAFADDEGNVYSGSISSGSIAGKTLQPAVSVTLASGITAASGLLTSGENHYAKVGQTVTLTAIPGYSLSSVTVTPATGIVPTVTNNGDGTFSFTMPNADVTISRSLRSTGKAVDVSYILADGTPQIAQAIALDGTETSHGQRNQDTWYYVGIDISHAKPLTLYGNVHIILADDCNMSVTTTDDYCIYADGHSLHIYGQTEGTGVLNARKQGRYDVIGIFNGTLGIHGGNVTATVGGTSNAIYVEGSTDGYALIIDRGTLTATASATASSGAGIYINGGNACINGGQVEATGGNGGIAVRDYSTAIPGSLTLGGGTLKASRFNTYSVYSYAGTLAVAEGYTYTDGTTLYNSATTSATLAALTNVTLQPCLVLADNASNTPALTANSGKTIAVQLAGRTLYKDGYWNTLCLPFGIADINAKDASDNYICPLHGATVKTLVSSIFSGGTLSMNFTEDKDNLTAIQAGVPYIVKWTPVDGYVNDDAHNIVSPVFTDVIVSNTTANVSTDCMDFVGTYSPTDIYTVDKTNLYLGGGNTLYYPWADGMTEYYLNAFRAYFQLKNGLTAGDPNAVREFKLNFGDGNGSAGVSPAIVADGDVRAPGWYTIDGRKLQGKPTKSGLYIHGGKKVVIK